jgi:hemolysin activation/secretion protein
MTPSRTTALLIVAMAVALGAGRGATAAGPGIEYVDARTGEPHAPPAPAELAGRLEPLLGAAGTPEGLERVLDTFLEHARNHGRPVMEVEAVPPARGPAAVDGVGARPLRLRVWPGLISSLSLEGGSAWTREVVAADWTGRTGSELDLGAVDDWLDWTHRNPFHQVTLSFEPGPEPATADGVLTLRSDDVVRGFATWRNDGVEPLGPQRFSTGVEIGDPAGLPIWLSAELVGGEDWPDYRSARGQLRWFLPWRHEVRVAGSWTTAELDGFLPGLPITSSLESAEMGARYVVPLGHRAGWRLETGLGFDFRRTESGVSVDGVDDRGEADTAQVVAEAGGRRLTETSETGVLLGVFWSPGGLTEFNETADAEVLRPGAEAEYAGVRADWISRRELPRAWAVVARGAAQWTSAPPLPTVQLAVSGANAVRGFDEAVVLADAGVWGGFEGHTPAWRAPWGGRETTVTPLAFVDAGWARNEAEDDDRTLASVGLGLRVRSGRTFSLAFDYGWRLTDPGGRAHFALVLDF